MWKCPVSSIRFTIWKPQETAECFYQCWNFNSFPNGDSRINVYFFYKKERKSLRDWMFSCVWTSKTLDPYCSWNQLETVKTLIGCGPDICVRTCLCCELQSETRRPAYSDRETGSSADGQRKWKEWLTSFLSTLALNRPKIIPNGLTQSHQPLPLQFLKHNFKYCIREGWWKRQNLKYFS